MTRTTDFAAALGDELTDEALDRESEARSSLMTMWGRARLRDASY